MAEYVYELRRADELVATGRMSDDRLFAVGDQLTIAGWSGIVRDVVPTVRTGEFRLIVQLRRRER
jgi:hypothetical protein